MLMECIGWSAVSGMGKSLELIMMTTLVTIFTTTVLLYFNRTESYLLTLIFFYLLSLPAGLVFTVDSTDRDRITEAAEELEKLLDNEDVKDSILLVLANKQDLPNAMSVEELSAELKLNNITGRQYNVIGTSAMDRDKLLEALDWLKDTYKTTDHYAEIM